MSEPLLEKVTVGDRVKFLNEGKPYRVRCRDERFLICTKPFNLYKPPTVLYTVIDLKRDVRGTEGVVFGMGAESDESCRRMLKRLSTGETEVSYRNNVPLDVERVITNH